MAFGKVYCFGPTFRAEKSKTRRHLTEFWMLEPEVAFATLDDILQLAEDMLVYVVQRVLERRRTELLVLERDLSKLECIQPPFPRTTYADASEILTAHPESQFVAGDDFGAPDETILSNMHDRPLMITRYPKKVKAFYMKRDPEDASRCSASTSSRRKDPREIIGGSHEDDLDVPLASIHELICRGSFRLVSRPRRYGSIPHGGRSGLERTVGLDHGDQASAKRPFPRMCTASA
jgi:asparaginyl-tRNA synthetase